MENDEKNQIFYINLATQRLKEKLIKDIQQSKLPIVNIYLLWQKLEKEIEISYYETLNQEVQQFQETQILKSQKKQ